MGFGDIFRGNADVVEHNKRRNTSDLATLDQSWKASGATLSRIALAGKLSGFKYEWQHHGGANGEKYTAPSKSVTLSYVAGHRPSSLTVTLDMNGTYTLAKAGEVSGEPVTTTKANKVLNTVNSWLMDVGAHYNFDAIHLLQRATDEQERALAQQRQAQRHGK